MHITESAVIYVLKLNHAWEFIISRNKQVFEKKVIKQVIIK